MKKYEMYRILICTIISILLIFANYNLQKTKIEYTYKQDILKIWSDIGYNTLK